MYYKVSFWLLIISVLLEAVTCQSYGLVHFRKNVKALSECIENQLDNFWFGQDPEMRKSFIHGFAEEFSWQTFSKLKLGTEITSVINHCINVRFVALDARRPRQDFEEDVKKALLRCTDNYLPESRPALPYFANEPPEYYNFLNLVLVTWPYSPENMYSTPVRQSEVQSYAEHGLRLVEGTYSNQRDYYSIYQFWARRARLFYDGQSDSRLIPYINHRYSSEAQAPYAYDDPRLFIDRSLQNFEERNPPATVQQVHRIRHLHPLRSLNQSRDGAYYEDDDDEMKGSEYYLELLLSKFYRILFFYLELLDRNLINVSHGEVPEGVRAILHNDTAYNEYLIFRDSYELSHSDNSVYRQNLLSFNCISERDLVMLFWTRIRNRTRSTVTSTTTKTIITTAKRTSTPGHERTIQVRFLADESLLFLSTLSCFLKVLDE